MRCWIGGSSDGSARSRSRNRPGAWLGLEEERELLALAEKEFDVFLTTDRGIPHQQDLSRFDLTVVVLTDRMDEGGESGREFGLRQIRSPFREVE